MTNKIIQGVLLDSAGHPISGAKIRFVSTSTKSVLNSVETVYPVGSDGAYNFSVQFGVYTIQICRNDEVQFRTVCANTYVFDANTHTLEELIQAQEHVQELSPELIREMMDILTQTNAARADVEDSADAAAASATIATTKASEAATSASTATAKATAAATSATNAATSASTATTKASEASTSAANAATSASTATTKATAAATSATNAATSATTATTKATAAATSANEAAQSAALAAGALIEAGSVNLSTGVYPTPIKDAQGNNRSCFWKVTVAGTVGSEVYGVGDSLVYSKEIAGYYKIDNTESVTSVNGKQGVVSLTKADVSLGNVDNTSDANKPVSTAQQSALNLKANLASPALTGTPSAPTAAVGTSTTQIATTAFVNAEIANDAAPKTHVGATGTAHGVATTSVAGFMSSTDKTKLDGVAAGANAYVHPASGVTAGTYKSVTVNTLGHITAGTNPTTLAGYGITDADPTLVTV